MNNIKAIHLILMFILSFFISAAFSQVNKNSTDSTITGIIQSRMVSIRILANSNVNVTTKNGIVKLSGKVQTEAEAEDIISIAQSVTQVKEVDASDLKIENHKFKFSDLIISAKINGQLIRRKIFSRFNIFTMPVHIKTYNGVVYLTGTVANERQKNEIIKAAHSIKGVKEVKANIKVSS